jgi:hypothetical protein
MFAIGSVISSVGGAFVNWLAPWTRKAVGAVEHDAIPTTTDPNAMKPARHTNPIVQRMGLRIPPTPPVDIGRPQPNNPPLIRATCELHGEKMLFAIGRAGRVRTPDAARWNALANVGAIPRPTSTRSIEPAAGRRA